jgi:hypothetical protein
MASLDYPYIISNKQKSSHTQWNENFDAISDQVNGNLDGDNFDPDAFLTVNKIKAVTFRTQRFWPSDTMIIKLPSNDGSHHVRWRDHQGNEILKVSSDGEVTFHGKIQNALAIGTILMYNGAGIDSADTRDTEIGEEELDTVSMPGWYVCNGQASTPDLRNKFIRGGVASGAEGGSDDALIAEHTHTVNGATGISAGQSITHTHVVSGNTGWTTPDHYHSVITTSGGAGTGQNVLAGNDSAEIGDPCETLAVNNSGIHSSVHALTFDTGNSAVNHTHVLTVAESGSSITGANMPAYYSLIFLIRMV